MLSGWGFTVTEAADGAAALARLERDGPADLALVDWHMPQMSGYDLVRAVRARPGFERMLIVMVTAETETIPMAQALEAGANEYVMKPFTPDILHDKLTLLGLTAA